jgi:hypothetical protein
MNKDSIKNGIYNTFNKPIEQQKFVRDNSSYQPNSAFYNTDIVNTYGENMRDMSQFNLQQNFKETKPILMNQDMTYKHNTLYDNMNANLLSETITEYRLNIDSFDRNIEQFPDPFKYVVTFAPVMNSTNPLIDDYVLDPQETLIYSSDPSLLVSYNDKLKRYYNPFITREFKNVKFIRIDNLVMPRFHTLVINDEWRHCPRCKTNFIKDDFERLSDVVLSSQRYNPDIETCGVLFTDRFIMLKIEELNDGRNLATNTTNSQAFTIFPDRYQGIMYWRGNPYYAMRTWYDSALGNINRLSFEFYNSWGVPITLNTTSIDYETKFIKSTPLLSSSYNMSMIKNDENTILFFIKRMTEIIKCVVILNFNLDNKINFYNIDNPNDIILNTNTFEINNNEDFFKELNEFVSKKGFVNVQKTTNKCKKITININDYINDVIWYSHLKCNQDKKIEYNLSILFEKYKKHLYIILEKLKIEIYNIPYNKYFQNHIMCVISCATNELNTKISYKIN